MTTIYRVYVPAYVNYMSHRYVSSKWVVIRLNLIAKRRQWDTVRVKWERDGVKGESLISFTKEWGSYEWVAVPALPVADGFLDGMKNGVTE